MFFLFPVLYDIQSILKFKNIYIISSALNHIMQM